MTHKEAVDFAKAIETISDTLDMEAQKLANTLYTFGDNAERVKEALRLYNEFIDAGIEERGRMFGYEVTVTEDGNHEISTEL